METAEADLDPVGVRFPDTGVLHAVHKPQSVFSFSTDRTNTCSSGSCVTVCFYEKDENQFLNMSKRPSPLQGARLPLLQQQLQELVAAPADDTTSI